MAVNLCICRTTCIFACKNGSSYEENTAYNIVCSPAEFVVLSGDLQTFLRGGESVDVPLL